MISFIIFVCNCLSVSIKEYCFLACKRVVLPLSLLQFLQHMLALLFFTGQSRSPCRGSDPRLLNYESPPSFTFIYRCATPLDLPPRFSRLLFLFFVPTFFEFIIPPRDSVSSFIGWRSFRSVSRSIKSTLLHYGESNCVSAKRMLTISAVHDS